MPINILNKINPLKDLDNPLRNVPDKLKNMIMKDVATTKVMMEIASLFGINVNTIIDRTVKQRNQ